LATWFFGIAILGTLIESWMKAIVANGSFLKENKRNGLLFGQVRTLLQKKRLDSFQFLDQTSDDTAKATA
jgi:hypothetical protein